MDTDEAKIYSMLLDARNLLSDAYEEHFHQMIDQNLVTEESLDLLFEERDRNIGALTKRIEAHPLHDRRK